MNYREALDFLLNLELFGVKLGLTNITKFLDRLGNPQNSYPSIHIGGTNGKGSVAAMIESMLVANGYKVGKFTSPHLVEYRERFRINKVKVPEEYIADFVSDHRDFVKEERITFFETATALAFQMFKDENVDFGIAEVGLGGRLDATNLLTPEVSVITQIALDHLKVLGDSIEKIATEKAGIIKHGVPVITSAKNPSALDILTSKASERDTSVTRLLPIEHYDVSSISLKSTRFEYGMNSTGKRLFETNMIGGHMAENAALALGALELLKERGVVEHSDRNNEGLSEVYWKGRFHVLDIKPRVIFDVAHNPNGMGALADTLDAIFPGRRFTVVFGVLQRRDFDLLFDELARFTEYLVICKPNTGRAAVIEEIVSNAISHNLKFMVIEDVSDAFDHARTRVAGDDYMIVTGSHFTLGEVYAHIEFAI